jgi:hypothetical protein
MKKILFIVLFLFILSAIGLIFYQFFWKKNEKGALQITSVPDSKVYIDNAYIGVTPLCFCPESSAIDEKNRKDMLSVGEHDVRLVPTENGYVEFQERVTIEKSVLAVVDRKFAKGSGSEGFVISLSKLPDDKENALTVVSIPDAADVYIDSVKKGQTPLQVTDLTHSDHTLTLQKDGYKTKTIQIRATDGYKLVAKGYLGIDLTAVADDSTTASDSATPTPSISVAKVRILQTGTGFLRVRDEASLGGKEVTQVSPGEEYPLLEEQTGWDKIQLDDGKEGWISSQYAEKVE